MKNNNPGTAIKCRFSNEVHKILEPNINIPNRLRWKKKKEYTNEEKLQIFDKIMELHNECSSELQSYYYQRRQIKRVQKERVARGVKPKKKTTKEEYLKSLKKDLVNQ